MWFAVVTGHMTLVDPHVIKPAMDAITDGWSLGRRARSFQFVKFEHCLGEQIDGVRAEFGLLREPCAIADTPTEPTPESFRPAA
jgi:ubiquinone biosynthesis protein Coq4